MTNAPNTTRRYELFPTTVMTFEYEAPNLNADLARHFLEDPRYLLDEQAENADSLNLMDMVDSYPVFEQLQSMFESALFEYCRGIGWSGKFQLSMQMFPNYAPARHYVPSHNHVAHVAGVYYVRTPIHEGRPIVDADASLRSYWRPEEGVLILHDPRFNASLNGGWQHFARVYPRPGLLIMFPAFLWHEVTPHFSNAPRLSVAANFTLIPEAENRHERRLQFSV